MSATPPADRVREHLEQVVSSTAFAKAERLRAFLRFVVEATLAGQQDAIKEYTIALEVCGRAPSFDPRTDPIVRVDANRLRARLDAYYRREGRNDTLRIHLPKGSYVPAITAITAITGGPRAASLVVLPFVHLGQGEADESFADGLTEELIHRLSRIQDLRVIARTSAFHYRSQGGDLRRIASELGVAFVVEGSVRWSRDLIRVTVQLTEVVDCSISWSGRYERHVSDVLAVQDDICRNIAAALEIQLVDQGPARPVLPVGSGAHVEYLKGRHFWNQRTASSLARSLDHYRRAIEIDPHYARAHCGIADTLLVQAFDEQVEGSLARGQARVHAQRAIELAPDLPEALISSAAVASALEWDWNRGDALFRRALALHPRSALGHYLYGILNLAPCGRWDEALIAMDRAIELDPVSTVLQRDLGIVHYLRGEYRDAEQSLHAASTLDPGFRGSLYWLGRALAEQGRLDEAVHMFEARMRAPSPNTRVLASLIHALGAAGRREEALDYMGTLQESADAGLVPALNLAIAQIGLGKLDDALAQLERAWDGRAAPLYQVAVDPVYRPLRDYPRFQAILADMGLGDVASPRS